MSSKSQSTSHADLAPCWLSRHWRLGATAGLGLGVVGQLAVALLAAGELDATLMQRLGALIYSSAGWICVALALGLATWGIRARRAGRVAAIVLSSAVLGTMALAAVTGTVLRVMSGSYMNMGVLTFMLQSSSHVVRGFTGTYLGWGIILSTVLLGSATIVARWLKPAATSTRELDRRYPAAVAALLLVLGIVYSQRGNYGFTRGMFVSAPLLALASSFETGFGLRRDNVRPDRLGEPIAIAGPPRSEHEKWVTAVGQARGERANVILLMLESLALSQTGLGGYTRPTTPALDELASESLWMTHAWTTATHSNYAQPAVLASLFPRRGQGLDQYERLDYPRFLFHDAFHQLGYATATISSQDELWQGMRRFQNTGTPTFFWHSGTYDGPHLDSGVEKTVPDEVTLDKTLSWLGDQKGRPWALYLNLQGTHFPYSVAAGVERPYQPDVPTSATFNYLGYPKSERQTVINRYDNALRHVDAQLARLRKYLEDTGQMDNTLWLITADHGEMFFERGLVTHGQTLYDHEARIPIFVRWPKNIAAEKRSEPVSHLDILPTVLDYLGLPPHPSWQGRSFRKPDPASVGKHAIFMNIQGLRFADAIVCWPYKLLLERTSSRPYLFDLAADPDEQNNLMESRVKLAKRLNDILTKQLIAQLDYHRKAAQSMRDKRFQPRLHRCPRTD